jgi:predicted Holliday junction resolvase-like endonuclease
MWTNLLLIIAWVSLVVAVVVICYYRFIFIPRLRVQLTAQLEARLATSKAVHLGFSAEQLAPYLPGFKYNPADVRFLGQPVDFVVFDGLTGGELRQVIIVEVKTGKSSLSKIERQIKEW